MKKFTVCATVLLLIISGIIFAVEPRQVTLGNLKITIQEDSHRQLTFCGDQSYDAYRLNNNRNRSYTFFADSKLMVFVGTDDVGLLPRADGSRMFHLLPFKTNAVPEFTDTDTEDVNAVLPDGRNAVFSKTTGELAAVEGFIVASSPIARFDEMDKKSGGIELTPEKGSVLIDYGWRIGEIPISQLWRTVLVLDGYGNKYKLKMSDFFRADPDDRDEVIFRFRNNEELDKFFKVKCPKLKY
ncbi:MAG: hypothetical protein JW982_01760 [Spirochaetes bacterium]|nr:hypothetical protein [Spirochaetota bacterium]